MPISKQAALDPEAELLKTICEKYQNIDAVGRYELYERKGPGLKVDGYVP
jgi:hypothetical protein